MKTVSVILPCLNEAESLGAVIETILTVFSEHNYDGEIIVVDNNSTDTTANVAHSYPVRYVFEPERGYGNAYRAGLANASGTYIIMGDPDASYDFTELPRFLSLLQKHDAVLGSRFRGEMEPGAMPTLHRYVGNPGIRLLLRLLFGLNVTEPSTGFIGLRHEVIPALKLSAPGMEFASEVLIRLKRHQFDLHETPINYHVRAGESKLRTWRDGWRHLRFILAERFRSA